jgi:septum formation protein
MAGIKFDAAALPIDEEQIKLSMRQTGASAMDTAIALAELKAYRVSVTQPERLVVGADQMLDADGEWMDKPKDRAQAKEQLLRMRGKTHCLISAVVVFRGGQRLWHNVSTATMTMREFSDQFLNEYLDKGGDGLLSSVGAYKLEGMGVQLFSAIDGDYFTILGLPLLPLLDFLRNHGEVIA